MKVISSVISEMSLPDLEQFVALAPRPDEAVTCARQDWDSDCDRLPLEFAMRLPVETSSFVG